MMETVESLITTVAQKVLGKLVVERPREEVRTAVIAAYGALIDLPQEYLVTDYANEDEFGKEYHVVKKQFDDRFLDLLTRGIGMPICDFALEAVKIIDDAIELVRRELPGLARKYNLETNDIESSFSNIKRTREKLKLLEKPIDLTSPWRRAKYNDLVKEKAGADWFTISAAERRQRAHDMGAEIGKEFEDFEVTNAVFSKFIEPTLIQPTFVTHLPKELVPLAKLSPDDPTTVEVFECCINGQEISPGYTEQNDPIAQRATLEHQAGGEQQKLDEDFLIALEHGMPPAGGIGIGIDRLCMMLLGQESIRDVILFPQLKPK
jgi:aspartyl/asparaginyl-tRNA synthetase